MIPPLVLSLFPGIGMLDKGFEEEGFCVVRGPDLLWGGDVRDFHPPAGIADGVIGGDPCQSHSALANLVRAKGLEPSFPDLTPEFTRVIEEARPAWFVRENVPRAPDLKPLGYEVTSFLLDNCWLGEAQMRKRRFWFGWNCEQSAPNLRRWIPGVALELPSSAQAVAADSRAVPVRHGGSGKVKATAVSCDGRTGHRVNDGTGDTVEGNFRSKVTAVGGHDGTADAIGQYRKLKQAPVTGRHDRAVGSALKDYSPPRRDLGEMLELQGFPRDFLDYSPFTMQAKRKMVGNGVPLPMSRAVACAVVKALERRTA